MKGHDYLDINNVDGAKLSIILHKVHVGIAFHTCVYITSTDHYILVYLLLCENKINDMQYTGRRKYKNVHLLDYSGSLLHG